jgi:polyisoprenoid-binding protein YceI
LARTSAFPSGHDHLNRPSSGYYRLDEDHTSLGFVVRQALITKVWGRFKNFDGFAYIDVEEPSRSRAEVTIEAASLTTGNEQRDAQLAESDFLGQHDHPHIIFRSTRIVDIDPTTWVLAGDLTIKGIARPVAVEFTFDGLFLAPSGEMLARFGGLAVAQRRDWNLTWDTPPRRWERLVGKHVKLVLEVSAGRDDDR